MLALAFAAFLVFGAELVLVGACQASLARDLGLDLSGTGLLVAVQALGVGTGVVLSGPATDRFPRRPLLAGASLAAAAALAGVDAEMGEARALLHLGLLGLGMGVVETVLNVAVAERGAGRAARALVLVHAGATLGAVLAPGLFAWLLPRAGWVGCFRALAAANLLVALAALALPLPAPRAAARSAWRSLRAALAPGVLPFAVLGFAYIGVETALTVLAVPFATGALGLDAARGIAAISAFWLGLLAGRLGVLALPRVDARLLAASGAGGAALLALLALGAGPPELLFAGAGLAMGGVFPVNLALAGDRFPAARGSASGLVVGAGALGGFAVPWLHGALGDWLGAGFAVPALAAWALVVAAAARPAARGGEELR